MQDKEIVLRVNASRESALTNDHYSTAFAMIETWLENQGASVARLNSNRQRLMDDLGNVISDGTIPDISLWISELIQNALDSTWADNVGAGRVELDFEENTLLSAMTVVPRNTSAGT